MVQRRNLKALERAINEAGTDADRATVYYNLGLFHDNNSREAEAVPNYESALVLGLVSTGRAECHA